MVKASLKNISIVCIIAFILTAIIFAVAPQAKAETEVYESTLPAATLYQLPPKQPRASGGYEGAMSYVIKTRDGSIIVIDGGRKDDGYDGKYLLQFLKDITGKSVPHVTAWFITHAHSDHYGALATISASYADQITVDTFYYALVKDAEIYEYCSYSEQDTAIKSNKAVDTCISKLQAQSATPVNVVEVKPKHMNESLGSFDFDTVHIDILSTYEDVIWAADNITTRYSGTLSTCGSIYTSKTVKELLAMNFLNNTCSIFRVTVGGKSILFLGDTSDAQSKALLYLHNENKKDPSKFFSLKSDIVQMAHHGQNGAEKAVYQLIDPDICLFPASEWIYDASANSQLTTAYTKMWLAEIGGTTSYASKDGPQNFDYGKITSTTEIAIPSDIKPLVFDAEYYLNAYPELAAYCADENALYKHFITYGIREGRRASLAFDIKHYINQNGQALVDTFKGDYEKGFAYFLENAKKEFTGKAKEFSTDFDAEYYRNNFSEASTLTTEFALLEHFVNASLTQASKQNTTVTVAEAVKAISDAYEAMILSGNMPETIIVNGITLDKPSYTLMAAQALDYISSKSPATRSTKWITANANYETSSDNFSATVVDKSGYLLVAREFINYFSGGDNYGKTGYLPAFVTLPGETDSSYSGNFGNERATIVLARVLNSYAKYNVLPEIIDAGITATTVTKGPSATPTPTPVATQAPENDNVTIMELALAAQDALKYYTSGSSFYPYGVPVKGQWISLPIYFYMTAQAIQDIYNNKDTVFTVSSLKFDPPDLEAAYSFGTKTVDQNFYMNLAIRQTTYAVKNKRIGASASYPTNAGNANGFPVSNFSGQVNYPAELLCFTRILAYYAENGTLPASVRMEKVPYPTGNEPTPTPLPAVTPTPLTTVTPKPTATVTPKPTATVAPTTAAPATQDPSVAYPTPHPAFSTIANGATFTVAQIAEAASGIISHYETYQELKSEYSIPKAVVINNQIISDQDWAYLSGYALAGIAGSWDPSGLSGYTPETTVAYKKCTPPALNANATYTADTIAIAKVVEIAWKTTNFANSNNGLMAASCGSAFPGYQVSYYSGILAAARALAYYSANGTLPTSVQYDKVSFIITDSDSNVAPEATVAPTTVAPTTAAPTTAAPTTAAPTVAPTTQAPTVAPTTAAPTEQPAGVTCQRKNILYAAYSINKYLTNNPYTFPNYSSIDGNTV
ncbi:MAG: MBL fold metallo-hydrolase, partial [Clostridia bacterium]|nr:MBL fold metallo-hydrolase [Clostridia bacterium]